MAIAIMSCRKLIGICSGTGCFNAYNESKDAFSKYKDNKPQLASFFQCSGCSDTISKDEDWKHKMNQLKKKNVDTIHIALCIKVECADYEKHKRILEKEGFKIVEGTHK